MKIGPYEIFPVETGRFRLDGGAMFGVVPWVFWSRTNPPDERQRIDLAARGLLIKGNGRTILVDNGNGNKWNEKLCDIYRLDTSQSDLLGSIASHGVSPADVTDVILTHLHFDHAGGSTRIVNERLVPTFPNARHYVQKKHWDLSQAPTDKDRASFIPDDFLPLQAEGLLEFLDGEGELFPGIELLVTYGHTTAQQLPKISDGTTTMLFCCDLIPTASHIPYPYIMAYDCHPLTTLAEKKRILPRAFEEHWILFLEHDPKIQALTLRDTPKGFAVDSTISLT